jgi:predicted dehydrogenase
VHRNGRFRASRRRFFCASPARDDILGRFHELSGDIMISAAIVGLGRWGQNLVRSVQGGSQRLRFVRGVARRPDSVREFATQQNLQLSARLDDALADQDIGAVVLATPHSLHVEQVVAAARAGKAVFCEKPLALTHAGAQRAVAACREAGVVLATGQDKRHWSSMRELAAVVASGRLGEILHVEGNFSNETSTQFPVAWRESPAESPGAGMTATGIHVVDAFVNLIGPVRCVRAQLIGRKPDPAPLDTVSVLLEFENGVSGVLCTVRTTPFFARVHVFGTAGSAEAVGETELLLRMAGQQPERRSFEPVNALRVELEAFADAIEGRADYPVTTQQMIAAVAAMEAINRSMESGAPVTL